MSYSELGETVTLFPKFVGQICDSFNRFITDSLSFLNTKNLYYLVQHRSQVFLGTCTITVIPGINNTFFDTCRTCRHFKLGKIKTNFALDKTNAEFARE
jgi:hypothetical protein